MRRIGSDYPCRARECPFPGVGSGLVTVGHAELGQHAATWWCTVRGEITSARGDLGVAEALAAPGRAPPARERSARAGAPASPARAPRVRRALRWHAACAAPWLRRESTEALEPASASRRSCSSSGPAAPSRRRTAGRRVRSEAASRGDLSARPRTTADVDDSRPRCRRRGTSRTAEHHLFGLVEIRVGLAQRRHCRSRSRRCMPISVEPSPVGAGRRPRRAARPRPRPPGGWQRRAASTAATWWCTVRGRDRPAARGDVRVAEALASRAEHLLLAGRRAHAGCSPRRRLELPARRLGRRCHAACLRAIAAAGPGARACSNRSSASRTSRSSHGVRAAPWRRRTTRSDRVPGRSSPARRRRQLGGVRPRHVRGLGARARQRSATGGGRRPAVRSSQAPQRRTASSSSARPRPARRPATRPRPALRGSTWRTPARPARRADAAASSRHSLTPPQRRAAPEQAERDHERDAVDAEERHRSAGRRRSPRPRSI